MAVMFDTRRVSEIMMHLIQTACRATPGPDPGSIHTMHTADIGSYTSISVLSGIGPWSLGKRSSVGVRGAAMKVVSLFSGAGALDLGLHEVGATHCGYRPHVNVALCQGEFPCPCRHFSRLPDRLGTK